MSLCMGGRRRKTAVGMVKGGGRWRRDKSVADPECTGLVLLRAIKDECFVSVHASISPLEKWLTKGLG